MDQMAESSEKVVMTDQPLLAYPPIKRIMKQEIPDQQQEVSTGEEENWTLQVQNTNLSLQMCLLNFIKM